VLKALSEGYGVKIEVSRRDAVIRIQADYATSEDVLGMLIKILEKIQCVRVDVQRQAPGKVNMDRLAHADNNTSTTIRTRKSPGSQLLAVSQACTSLSPN